MPTSVSALIDEDFEFQRRFEGGEVLLSEFNHEAHVKLAWVYLNQLALPEAMIRFRDELKRFAGSHGKAALYHETITFIFLFLIHERLHQTQETLTWNQFKRLNSDLISNGKSLLLRYYSEKQLFDSIAKHRFLFPTFPVQAPEL